MRVVKYENCFLFLRKTASIVRIEELCFEKDKNFRESVTIIKKQSRSSIFKEIILYRHQSN